MDQKTGVARVHGQYEAASPLWQRCRDVYAGSDAVKKRGVEYLPKVAPDMEQAAYESYLLRALFFGVLQKTVYGVAGTVLRNPEVVKWTTAAQQARMEADLNDVDGTGANLSRWLFASLRDELLVTGRHAWAMDWSSGLGRPVWRSYPAEAVTYWRTAKVNGIEVITMMIVAESEETIDAPASASEAPFESSHRKILRVIWLDQSGQMPVATSEKWVEVEREVIKGEKETTMERKWEVVQGSRTVAMRLGVPLDFLPVIIIGANGVTADVTDPPFRDMVDVNLSHYRTSADIEWGRHFTALPTPWVVGVPEGTTKLTIGSGAAWLLSGDGAQAGMLEYTGQGLGALEKALADKEAKMAALGARPFEQSNARPSVETAEALRMRQAADVTSLDTLARALSEAATRMVSWHVWWRGDASVKLLRGMPVSGAVTVEMSREFMDMNMTAEELRAWVEAYQNDAISFETFYARLVSAKLAREGIEAIDELKLIRAGQDAVPKVVPVDSNIDNEDEDDNEDEEDENE